jgi:hypothetical protein
VKLKKPARAFLVYSVLPVLYPSVAVGERGKTGIQELLLPFRKGRLGGI